MADITQLDPATLQPSPEVDALMTEIVMRWYITEDGHYYRIGTHPDDSSPVRYPGNQFCPSTDPAHAGELRRMAVHSRIEHGMRAAGLRDAVKCVLWIKDFMFVGEVAYSETNNDPAQAEALAVVRAWVAALQARAERSNQNADASNEEE